MSSANTLEPPAKQKKKESWLGVAFTTAICAGFLWWWFSLPNTPEPVGIAGLVTRAKQEAKAAEASAADQLALELDIYELAMLELRHTGQEQAAVVAGELTNQKFRDRFWREAALATFNQAHGDVSPALKTCENITDTAAKAAAKDAVIAEMAIMGMHDGALLLAEPDVNLQGRLARIFSESGVQEKAAALLATLEVPETLAKLTPPAKQDLAWTNLWLRRWDKVEAALPSLEPAVADELWQDYMRASRLERSAEEARSVLSRLPSHLVLSQRLEAATQLQGSLENALDLLAELKTKAETQPSATHWLQVAQAVWKLQNEGVIPWKQAAEKAVELAANLSEQERAFIATEVGKLHIDAANMAEGARWLTAATNAALKVEPTEARFAVLTHIYEQAFRSGAPDQAQEVLGALQNTLAKAPGSVDAKVLINALFRDGRWPETLAILENQPSRRDAYVDDLLTRITESTAAELSFGISQDNSHRIYRQLAQTQGEAAATQPALRLQKGPIRARAWLAIAKGLSKPAEK